LLQALSEFADYVQKQQALRRAPGSAAAATKAAIEDHEELDILDQLGLAEESSHIRLKEVLLDRTDNEESFKSLAEYVTTRLNEGHGEALFDLGLEDNGDSMGFSKEDWDYALERLQKACDAANADLRVLMTRNVGGDVEEGAANGKEKGACGKLMIRRRPGTVDDVIETRIAVVGNGAFFLVWHAYLPHLTTCSRRWKKYHAGCPCQRRAGRWTWKGSSQPVQAQTRNREWTNQLGWHGDHGIRHQRRGCELRRSRTQADLGGDWKTLCKALQ
jgi:hypothetical protein